MLEMGSCGNAARPRLVLMSHIKIESMTDTTCMETVSTDVEMDDDATVVDRKGRV